MNSISLLTHSAFLCLWSFFLTKKIVSGIYLTVGNARVKNRLGCRRKRQRRQQTSRSFINRQKKRETGHIRRTQEDEIKIIKKKKERRTARNQTADNIECHRVKMFVQ